MTRKIIKQTDNLCCTQANGIVTICITRPQVRNSLCETSFDEFLQILYYCQQHEHARVVVIQGEGKVFCSGGMLLFLNNYLTKIPIND